VEGKNCERYNNFRYSWYGAGTHLQRYSKKSLQQALKHMSLQTEQWEKVLVNFFHILSTIIKSDI